MSEKQFTIAADTPGVIIELTFGDIAESLRVWKVSQVEDSFVIFERDGQKMKMQTISRYHETIDN